MKVQTIKNELSNPNNYRGLTPVMLLYFAGMALFFFLLLPYAFEVLGEVFFPKKLTMWHQLALYKWTAIGCALYVFLRRHMKNVSLLEAFSHESTHMIVALLFRRRIHAFACKDDGSGIISTSGNNKLGEFLMTLAPYCLPICTYVLLFIRPHIYYNSLWAFDLFIGLSMAFHYYCFKSQTNICQPDIQQYPPIFSMLFIITTTLMNLCIIWVCYLPKYPLLSSIWRLVTAVYENFIGIFI